MQSLIHTFGDEFRAHLDRPCDRARPVAIPKIVDLDEAAGRFSYDERYSLKRPDWSYVDATA
jgi:hypothetical protein